MVALDAGSGNNACGLWEQSVCTFCKGMLVNKGIFQPLQPHCSRFDEGMLRFHICQSMIHRDGHSETQGPS